MNVNLPIEQVETIEAVAKKNNVTLSWVCRIIMRNPKGFRVDRCRRPRNLIGTHHQFQICTYGDKRSWKLLVLAKESEFGPYFRRLLELYLPHLDELDFEASRFNKLIEGVHVIKPRGSLFLYPLYFNRFKRRDFHPKNPEGNNFLRDIGLGNRGGRRKSSRRRKRPPDS